MASERFYNTFSFLYPVVDIFLKPQKKRLLREINALSYGQLLEIGVGNGSHLHLYKTHQITAIDTSKKMLAAARRNHHENIKLIQMDGENLLFPDQTFNYVVLSHVITVVSNPENLLEEAYRVLKPNGQIFILNHFTPKNGLRYMDYMFQRVSRILHFRSVFDVHSLAALRKFNLLKEIDVGQFSYFKLLIYVKA